LIFIKTGNIAKNSFIINFKKLKMERILLLTPLLFVLFSTNAQRLVVRMDDMGASRAENLAIIKCYTEGIGTSVEVMTVCPWFLEAAVMLKEHPGLDVGIHVAFNSEWANYKWKPITHCPTLCDEDGYLLAGRQYANIDIKEAENELRAQIELGLKYMGNVTHITDHMMWAMRPEFFEMAVSVAEEYGLRYQGMTEIDKELDGLTSLSMIRPDASGKRESTFLEALSKMEKGKTYWTIEHPGLDNEEMKGIYVKDPAQDVGGDRQDVTDTFTSPKVIQYIKEQGIELISFGDLIKEYNEKNIND